jgi:TRAP-type C4-dicarboxylate transport system permease small subunit
MTDAAPISETQAFAIEEQVPPRPSARLRFLMAPLEAFVALLLVGLIGLVLVAVFWRYVLSSPITAADEIASFLFLWR